MGWNKDYEFDCMSQPLVLLSATLVYTRCGQIAVQEPVRPFQDPAVRLYRWHWLHGSWDLSSPGLRPPYSLWWIDDIVQTLVGGDYILQAFSAGERFSLALLSFTCISCVCVWFVIASGSLSTSYNCPHSQVELAIPLKLLQVISELYIPVKSFPSNHCRCWLCLL